MEVVKALPTWAKVAIAAGAVYGAKQVYDTFSEKNLTGEVVVLTGAGGGGSSDIFWSTRSNRLTFRLFQASAD